MTLSTGLQSFVIAKALGKRRGDLETYGWNEGERGGEERRDRKKTR
jgi:hypothetical protein